MSHTSPTVSESSSNSVSLGLLTVFHSLCFHVLNTSPGILSMLLLTLFSRISLLFAVFPIIYGHDYHYCLNFMFPCLSSTNCIYRTCHHITLFFSTLLFSSFLHSCQEPFSVSAYLLPSLSPVLLYPFGLSVFLFPFSIL